MTDTTTTPDLTGLEDLTEEQIIALHEAFPPEVTEAAPAVTAPVVVPEGLYSGFVSTKQAEGFLRLVTGGGLTEQQIHARYPDIPLDQGPKAFDRLSKEIESVRREAMSGERRSRAQRGHLTSCVANLRASGLRGAKGLANSIEDNILFKVGIDRLDYSDAIDDAHVAMNDMNIPIPERQDESVEAEVKAGALESSSTVTGVVPAEEPF